MFRSLKEGRGDLRILPKTPVCGMGEFTVTVVRHVESKPLKTTDYSHYTMESDILKKKKKKGDILYILESFIMSVLNFGEKNRDSKILGGGKRLFFPPLEKISLQLPFLAKNKIFFFFQRL